MDKSNTPVSQSGQERCSIHIVWQSICMNADIGAALPPLCGTPTFAQELEPSTQPTEAEELVSEPVSEPPAESPEEPASTPLEEPEADPSAEPVILSDDTPAEPNDTVESVTEEPVYSFDVIWGDLEFTYTRNRTQWHP